MKRISDIIVPREDVYAVQKNEPLRQVAQRMTQWSVRAVTVVDGEQVVGIVSNWDFLTKAVARGKDLDQTTVSEIMTPNPMTATPDTTYLDCLVTMLENDFQHLVVLTPDDKLLGTVALGDLLKIDKNERDELIQFYQEMFAGH